MKTRILPEKVFAFTAENALFSAPCHVVVGVSGGADSMALLHCLHHWMTPGLKITAVHIHHGLRGDTADQDAAFVQSLCDEWGIPFLLRYANVPQYVEKEHVSVEDAGRRLRYALFEQVRCDVGADFILTAHTASDQAETVLMRLLRGCGTDGLSGIPTARGVIRRPLLCCSRDEVEAYCAQHNVPYITDETNADLRFTRNRIRHEILPLLRTVNPSVDDALLRLSRHTAEDSAYLRKLAAEGLQQAKTPDGYDVACFLSHPQPIRRRMLHLMMTEAGIPTIEETHILAIEQILLSGNGYVSLPNTTTTAVEQGRLRIFATTAPTDAPQSVLIDTFPCSAQFGIFPFTLELQNGSKTQNVHKLFSNQAIDYDKIQGRLCLRCRREGDYFHPAGRHIGKSLKKLMNEWHLPSRERDIYPILCDDAGIVLVPGYACDERVRPSADTKHFLVWLTDTV